MVVPNGVPNQVTADGTWHLWETDETVVYTGYDDGPVIYRVAIGSGEPELIARADTTIEWASQPYVDGRLPGGKLLGGMQAPNATRHVVAILDPGPGEWTIGEEGVANASYAGRGYVTYQVGNDFGKLVVRPIDTKSGAFTGSPREVLPAMRWGGYNVGVDGSLVYIPQIVNADGESQLFALDLEAARLSSLSPSTTDETLRPSVSPTANEIALEIAPARGGDQFIAVYDRDRGVLMQRTFSGVRRYPRWSPDGEWLFYHSDESQIFRRRADGSGEEELVLEDAVMPDVSPDGRWLAAARTADGGTDLIAVEIDTGRTVVVDSSNGNQLFPDFSPSGRHIAYRTFSSGEQRIAVRPLEGSGYWIVSDLTGEQPRWSPDEKYIYFRSAAQSGGIFRIAVETSNGFRTVGEPERIASTYGDADFDVVRDGRSLIIAGAGVSLQEGVQTAATLGWWQNWVQSLPENEGF